MRRDAAALACVCKDAAAALPTSRRHAAVRVGRSGAVLEPANGAFDVTVAPGEDVQAALDRCPPGGCVLLLPGVHAGPLVLGIGPREGPRYQSAELPGLCDTDSEGGSEDEGEDEEEEGEGGGGGGHPHLASEPSEEDGEGEEGGGGRGGTVAASVDKAVHVFGRGRASLRTAGGAVVASEAATATCDGLIIRHDSKAGCFGFGSSPNTCVWVSSGALRLQACDITRSTGACVSIEGGADPMLVNCWCVGCARPIGGGGEGRKRPPLLSDASRAPFPAPTPDHRSFSHFLLPLTPRRCPPPPPSAMALQDLRRGARRGVHRGRHEGAAGGLPHRGERAIWH